MKLSVENAGKESTMNVKEIYFVVSELNLTSGFGKMIVEQKVILKKKKARQVTVSKEPVYLSASAENCIPLRLYGCRLRNVAFRKKVIS